MSTATSASAKAMHGRRQLSSQPQPTCSVLPFYLTGEGAGKFYTMKSCFDDAAAGQIRGKNPSCAYSGVMGSSKRFTVSGGLAGIGDKSHFTQPSGQNAMLRDIRTWPDHKRTVGPVVGSDGSLQRSKVILIMYSWT